MRIIKKVLKGKAVYWPKVGYDDHGKPIHYPDSQAIFVPPVEIKCRWERKSVQFTDKNSVAQTSKAVVYVDRELELGGVLWEGELVNIQFMEDPFANEDAWEIRGFDSIPDLKYKDRIRIAYL